MARPKNPPKTHDYDPDDFIPASEAVKLFKSITNVSSFQYQCKQGNLSFTWGMDSSKPHTDKYPDTKDNRCVMYRVAAIEREAKAFLSNKIKAKVA